MGLQFYQSGLFGVAGTWTVLGIHFSFYQNVMGPIDCSQLVSRLCFLDGSGFVLLLPSKPVFAKIDLEKWEHLWAEKKSLGGNGRGDGGRAAGLDVRHQLQSVTPSLDDSWEPSQHPNPKGLHFEKPTKRDLFRKNICITIRSRSSPKTTHLSDPVPCLVN